jgi:hypothetical protein
VESQAKDDKDEKKADDKDEKKIEAPAGEKGGGSDSKTE